MKNMKNFYYMFLASIFVIGACTDPDEPFVDATREGGLLHVQTKLVNYVVGDNRDYEFEVLINQAKNVKVSKVDVYATFSTVERDDKGLEVYRDKDKKEVTKAKGKLTPLKSNEVMIGTITPTDANKTALASIKFNLATLTKGFTIEGQPFNNGEVPSDDNLFRISDAWTLKFRSTTSAGEVHENYTTAKLAVSTRFAGTYIASNSIYQHPTSGRQGGWDGKEAVIESVTATADTEVYKILRNGNFTTAQNANNWFYFIINKKTLKITIPKKYDGKTQTVWNTDVVANCQDDAAKLPNVKCATSNKAVKDPKGKDKIIMSHGYIRASGTRQFYYELTKK